MFVSLGSIIGSGWLLGALTAAKAAGPASLLSWILAAAIMAVLALVHIELGAAYPVAGGTARFPRIAFGPWAGFAAGFMSWLQAVAIAPIEVEATLSYCANISWIKNNVTLLHTNGTLTGAGIGIGSLFMLVFIGINIVGVKLLADTNSVVMIWKTLVPILTVVVLLLLRHHFSNFSAGGGFFIFGAKGVFAALPLGVVFAIQGFEQCIQLAGEARNPQKDLPRAVLTALGIGTIIYLALEVAFVSALAPSNLAHGWANPIGKGNFGPYATLASAAGAGWLAWMLYLDAVISPAGTGLVYMGTTARLSYGIAKFKGVPRIVASVARSVPIVSLIIAFIVGELVFLPFPSWSSLVGVVTSTTAIMYAFAPVALHRLRLKDPDRERPYKLRGYKLWSPLGFVLANLVIYWSDYQVIAKVAMAIIVGLIIFGLTQVTLPASEREPIRWAAAWWIWPWYVGLIVIGALGQYNLDAKGNLSTNLLPFWGHVHLGFHIPFWWDLGVVAVFSLAIYYLAVYTQGLSSEEIETAINTEADETVDPNMVAA
jgi:amino acid transporter